MQLAGPNWRLSCLILRSQASHSSCWLFLGRIVNNILCELSNMKLCNISSYWHVPLFIASVVKDWPVFVSEDFRVHCCCGTQHKSVSFKLGLS